MLITKPHPYEEMIEHFMLLSSNELSNVEKGLLKIILIEIFTALSLGHSCLNLEHFLKLDNAYSVEMINNILEKSGLFAKILLFQDQSLSKLNLTSQDIKPFCVVTDSDNLLLYVTRYWYYELFIARTYRKLTSFGKVITQELDEHFKEVEYLSTTFGFPNFDQFNAIKTAVTNKLSIITGGPGTGKTTSIMLIIWLAHRIYLNKDLKIKICAPTGKAASRIKEAIKSNLPFLNSLGLNTDMFERLLLDTNNFITLHRLLGYLSNNIYFKHNQENPIEEHILIIDEASMIGLPLFYKLLRAIDHDNTLHVIFLGDKNQLSSVEEGYVFASIIERAQEFNDGNVAYLKESKRSGGDIVRLSNAILEKNFEECMSILKSSSIVSLKDINLPHLINDIFSEEACSYFNYLNYIEKLTLPLSLDEVKKLFKTLNKFIVLTTTNEGKFGVKNLNFYIENVVKNKLSSNSVWYSGRPIIILKNDYNLNLNNGDIGICIIENNLPYVIFEDGLKFNINLIHNFEVAYAITIHKSQGSEYENVAIIFDANSHDENNSIYTNQTLYTAITRARNTLRIYAKELELKNAIITQATRASGLLLLTY